MSCLLYAWLVSTELLLFAEAEDPVEFFERRIRPVLVERCASCHGGTTPRPKAGLRLDSRSAMLAGGESGPAVVPGKPAESLLVQAISYSGTIGEMPPDGRLPPQVVADFKTWIADGAVYPGDSSTPASAPRQVDVALGRKFWSFQPVELAPLPQISDPAWPARKIDHFILERLDEHAAVPNAPADRRTLIRRLSIDLRGVPPTFEEAAEFSNDDSVDAYDRLVDRYLSSPAYGERWARHWLDVARYAEDNPTSESTCPPPRFAYRYRDWTIRALNQDLPYDEFVRRQLAADLLPAPPEEIAALGFLGLAPVYHKEPKLSADVIATIVADEWDERLDTIARGLLGLTVACARCHDHKFDPIRTEDYYALAGVLASTQLVEWPLEPVSSEQAAALTEVQRTIIDAQLRLDYAKKMRDTAKRDGGDPAPFEATATKVEAELQSLKSQKLFDGPIANAVRDAGLWIDGADPAWTYLDYRPGLPKDLPVFLRGNANRHGARVPRRFLEVLSSPDARPFQSGSGRKELADAIVVDAAPLAARVWVNRVWGWRFGQPLVRTPSNFGRLGEPPSHPRLLDDLAARFIASGWSLKWLQREIALSATWRQSSRPADSTNRPDPDPDNRLLGRMNSRRLDAEALRDSLLALSGRLDARQFGPSDWLDDPAFNRRTVYGVVSRQKPADLLRLFDFPDAKQHAESRQPTTTPLQHLFLLNSPFVQTQADELARLVWIETPDDPARRIARLFERVLLRPPSSTETAAALELLARDADRPPYEAWELLAQALLVSNEALHVE